jgi:hypothetical protein
VALTIQAVINQMSNSLIPEFPVEFQQAHLIETVADKLSKLAVLTGDEQKKQYEVESAFATETIHKIHDLFRKLNTLDISKFSAEQQRKIRQMRSDAFVSNNLALVLLMTIQKMTPLIQNNPQ